VLKEVKALLPVASLWASLDYKSVANWPIMVSRILLLTKLISEINPEIHFQESSLLGKDTSYDTGGSYGTWTYDYTPRDKYVQKFLQYLYFCTLKSNSPSDFDFWSKVKTEYKTF